MDKNNLQEIFLRLPVTSLMRCRSVCKLWRDLIRGHTFTRLYTSQSLEAKTGLIVYSSLYGPNSSCTKLYFIDRRHDTIPTCIPARFPLQNLNKFKIIGSCDGLLCLTCDTGKCKIVLCNPLLGEFIEIPHHIYKHFSKLTTRHCGFGLCLKTQSYKILELAERRVKIDEFFCELRYDAYVHRVGDPHWKCIDIESILSWSKWASSQATHFKGALHWVSWISADKLCVFEFEDEVFKEMRGPRARDAMGNRFTCGVLRNFLSVMNTSRVEVDVWLMKEYGDTGSWEKYVTIKLFQIDFAMELVRVLDYQEEGGLFVSYGYEFGFYDCEKREFEKVDIVGYNRGLLSGGLSMEVVLHCDTLVSPLQYLQHEEVL